MNSLIGRKMEVWKQSFKSITVLIQDGPIKELNHNVTKPSLAMEQQLKIIETSLKECQDSIRVDSQFYL